MKNLYNEYYRVPKEGMIKEKVMLIRMTISVIVMIACLAAMSFSAYAFYAYNVSSIDNMILAANFDAEVSMVTVVDSNQVPVPVSPSGSGAYLASLEAGTEYTVTLSHIGTAQTGFCVVTANGCEAVYHTQQLGLDGDVRTMEIAFTVTVNHATVLSVLPHWGTSFHYDAYTNKGVNEELYILDGELLTLMVAPPEDVLDGGEDTTTSTAVTTTTTALDTTKTTTETTVTTQSAVTETTSESAATESTTTTSAVEDTTTAESETTTTTESTETQVTEETRVIQ